MGLLERIEDLMIGAVANGMDRHRETHLGSFASMLEEFLAIHIEDAAVFAFPDIGLEHRRRMRTQSAIHEGFDIANA